MSRSNPFTFTISGAYYLIRWLTEIQAGFYRACYQVRLFVDNLPAAKTFTVLSLHISNIHAKKRGKGKNLILTNRAVMLDGKVRDNSNNISIIEEASADCALPMPPGPTPLWGLRAVPDKWADVCGFIKPPVSDPRWRVRQHGAFSILHRPTDQSCHHEASLHVDFVEWRHEQPPRRTRSKDPLQRTLCAAPLRQTQRGTSATL